MTSIETPLPEIAHLLPAEQAARLGALAAPIQNAVLVDVRFLVAQWEQSGVELDPITFSRVLGPTVDILMVGAVSIYMLVNREGEQ